jgi:hypothetical protein
MKSIARTLRCMASSVTGCLAVLVATTTDAHAYVDPGTGAMIIQIVGAIVAGTLFYFRQLRQWIAEFFGRLLGRTPPKDDQH